MWIGPEGGTLTYKSLTLVVPPGAVEERTLFEIASAPGLNAAPNQEVIESFELGPTGLTFHEALRATVSEDTELTNVALYLSSSGEDWEKLEDSEYDASKGEATGSIPHFSFLSLQGEAETAGSGGTANVGGAGPTTGGSSADGGGLFGGASYGGLGGEGHDDYEELDCEEDGECNEDCDYDYDCENDYEIGLIGGGDHVWAAQVHEEGSVWFRSMTLGQGGSIYLAGVQAAGDEHRFLVATLSPGGAVVEQRELPSMASEGYTPGVLIDRMGNAVTFGSVPTTPENLDSEYFLTKYDATGQELWSRFSSTGGTSAEDAIVDEAGNIYVTGYIYEGELDGEPDLYDGSDAFLVKYDSAGTRLWSRIVGMVWGTGSHLALAPDGGVVVAGFADSIPGVADSAGSNDMLVAKYDADGAREWARLYGTVGVDRSDDVTVDHAGNVLVAGWLTDTENGGQTDLGLAKFDAAGTFLWSSRSGLVDESEDVRGVAADSAGNIYVTGSTAAPLDSVTPVAGVDILLMKYAPNGQKQWTRLFGTDDTDEGSALAVDSADALFVGVRTRGHLAAVNADFNFDLGIIKYESDALE